MTKNIWMAIGVIVLVIAGILGWLFSPYFSSFTAEPMQLKIGWSGSKDSGLGQAVGAYVGDVKTKNAHVALSLYPAGKLGEKPAVLEGIRVGQPYMAFMTMDEATQYSDKGKVLSLPLLFKDNSEIEKFVDSNVFRSLSEDLNAKGFQVIGWIGMTNDSLWLDEGKVFPKDTKKLTVASKGFGLGENLWKEFDIHPKPLPAGIWKSENLSGTIQGILTSSEWMLGSDFFKKRPYRVTIGGVKPVLLVMNRELFLSLPVEDQQKLMTSTKVWSEWNADKIEKINFDKMAGQREMSTFAIPEADYPYLARVQVRGLTKDQLAYLEGIREALGGLFFYEPRPEKPVVPIQEIPVVPAPVPKEALSTSSSTAPIPTNEGSPNPAVQNTPQGNPPKPGGQP